jgi:hypothetical protein
LTPDPDSGRPDRDAVLASYADGVAAIGSVTASLSDWGGATPCGSWTALDLAGHLVAIARYYHRLLDAAEAGNPIRGLPRGEALAAMNAEDLSGVTETDGQNRIAGFCDLAGGYGTRLRRAGWNEVLGAWTGIGEWTVAEHTGVAIGEWHVHAWDLARAAGGDHRPADPVIVALGQRANGRIRESSDLADPWDAVLAGYGRDVGWTP